VSPLRIRNEILEAVRRGWLPEQIEAVTSKYALEGHTPPLEDVLEWIDILIANSAGLRLRVAPRHWPWLTARPRIARRSGTLE